MFCETLGLVNNVPRLWHLNLDRSELWTSVGFVETKSLIYKLLEPCMYLGKLWYNSFCIYYSVSISYSPYLKQALGLDGPWFWLSRDVLTLYSSVSKNSWLFVENRSGNLRCHLKDLTVFTVLFWGFLVFLSVLWSCDLNPKWSTVLYHFQLLTITFWMCSVETRKCFASRCCWQWSYPDRTEHEAASCRLLCHTTQELSAAGLCHWPLSSGNEKWYDWEAEVLSKFTGETFQEGKWVMMVRRRNGKLVSRWIGWKL